MLSAIWFGVFFTLNREETDVLEFLNDYTALQHAFFYCAVFGGALFVVRAAMTVLGGDIDEAPADTDIAVDTDTGGESTRSFKILTIQGLTGFFMMFGLVGLTASRGGEGVTLSFVYASTAGFATIWILDLLMQFMLRFQSSGNVNIHTAVGKEGTVYLTIPADGVGKIQLAINGRLREYNAVSESKEELKTGGRARVVRVVNDAVLSVQKV